MALWFPEPTQGRAPPYGAEGVAPPAHFFRAWTGGLYVSGAVRDWERLSDVMNRRQPLRVEDARSSRTGTFGFAGPVRGELVLDPLEIDMVMAGPLDPLTALRSAARRIHKVRYVVVLKGENYEARGTIHLFPGQAPELALIRTTALFVPVTGAIAYRHGRVVSDPRVDVVLVNRHTVSEIRQVDWAS